MIRGIRTAVFSDWDSPEWWAESCIQLPGKKKLDDILHKIWYDPGNVNPQFPFLLSGVHVFQHPDCEGDSTFQAIERSFAFDWNDEDEDDDDDDDDESASGMETETAYSDAPSPWEQPADNTDVDMNDFDLFAQSPSIKSQPANQDEEFEFKEDFDLDKWFQYNNLIQLVTSPNPQQVQTESAELGGRAIGTVYINDDDKDFNPTPYGTYEYIFFGPEPGFDEELDAPLSMRMVVDWEHRYPVFMQ
ncbi:hypothetical protein TWF730_009825 [Orbilia blumenaviensis]|uniref:Uncharacterized protein n=1 Tax=Orbilia blumenaviensis TaxID=1796055 RepID=A0AAV9USV7_9PEZI